MLRWLDTGDSREWIEDYKECALAQEGSVPAAPRLDEAAMAREGVEA